MVSPRKRPTTATVQDHHHHQGADRAKSRKFRQQVFAKKKFFLDIKNLESSHVKELAKDLLLLGGAIEPFFSKEVTTVITDAPEWKLRPQSSAKEKLGLHFAPSPSTSVGTPLGANNSPTNWSPLSVQEDGLAKQKFQAKSRVETILEKARQQNVAAENTCDVLESAQKFGITVWLLPKIIVWIENYKRRYGPFDQKSHRRSHSSIGQPSEVEQRELKAPYIKFEATNHEFKPVFTEFRRFPKLYCGGRAGQSPFFMPDSLVRHKLRDYPDKQHPQALPKVQKKIVEKVVPAQSGYCEICECPFSELEEHLSSKVHTARVGLSHLWTKLDSCIEQVNRVTSDSDIDEEDIVGSATSDQ